MKSQGTAVTMETMVPGMYCMQQTQQQNTTAAERDRFGSW